MLPARRFRNTASTWQATAAIWRIIRHEEVDIVHSVMAMGHLYGALARLGTHARGVWFQHMNVWDPTFLDHLASISRAASTFTNSAASARAQRWLWNWTGGISVVYPGMDLKEFSPDRASEGERLRQDLGIPERHAVLGMAGRLHPWKGQHVFLEAAEILSRQFPHTTFLVVGDVLFGLDEEYKRSLLTSVKERGLDQRVLFIGFHEDMAAVYAAMDIAVHASIKPEPFGLVVVEAMAMARPVVASDAGGAREIVLDSVARWLTPMGDSASLAERIGGLLDDPGLRERAGREGRRRVEERSSTEQILAAVEDVYHRVMDSSW